MPPHSPPPPLPLIVACFDDLFVRQAHRPVRVGVALSVLVACEFFISVEVLLLLTLFAVTAAALVVGLQLIGPPGIDLAFNPPGAPRLVRWCCCRPRPPGVPLWHFFARPAHLVGGAWPTSTAGTAGSTPAGFVNGFLAPSLTQIARLFGGYQ